ncbi:hypothetical protein CJ030_MR4G002244 [Morella rubra]|uniref:Uncharacterized protein n=1 Tax=Morella rubra TaxID=262757 RepID=A0A6A1VUL0_9ROSI|nr:hypothetical protein CJ030_MR4G002244 [Morella rubra]
MLFATRLKFAHGGSSPPSLRLLLYYLVSLLLVVGMPPGFKCAHSQFNSMDYFLPARRMLFRDHWA